ncbi:hypothetical protein R3P38DRAFT_2952481 [Favolaschia claudopus]|uniref:Uncharacterized protein n=1 Tax=Favolaschia claudopus TaxID=2862362 RepID=A0AAW0BFU9_9AGAR
MSRITPEEIDEHAEKEGWFRPVFDQPPFTLILQYLTGTLSLEDTVTQLTNPINASYSSADSGNAIRQAESDATAQREFHSEAAARELWGDPLPEDEVPAEEVPDAPSTEGQLWELWYAVLHAAKRYPWRNDENNAHDKLVALVAAIKRVPDPPLPPNANKALRGNWIWGTGTLWSDLVLLGASSREIWNDSPGTGAGYSDAAIVAWTNVNAFTARLTSEDVNDYSLYAIWAMRDALETDPTKKASEESGTWLDACVPAAAAWILIWGRPMFERREVYERSPTRGDPGRPGDLMVQRTKNKQSAWTSQRWAFWKARFEEISVAQDVKEETRIAAGEAFGKMKEIES